MDPPEGVAVKSSRIRVSIFGITQSKSPPGPKASIFSSPLSTQNQRSTVCKFGESSEKSKIGNGHLNAPILDLFALSPPIKDDESRSPMEKLVGGDWGRGGDTFII